MEEQVETYIQREVTRQHDPHGYGGMIMAWSYAMAKSTQRLPTEIDACILAYYIKSHTQENIVIGDNNYRHVRVQVGDSIISWEHCARQMTLLFNHIPAGAEVDDWIKRLLEIHPWVDGNGRTASIIRNWFLGTLESPFDLPYYFGEIPCEN